MGVWNCPNCDYKNSDSSKTCASCGASRPGAYRVNASATTWKCPKCNTSNSTNVSKCSKCGASRYGDTVRTQHEEPEERKGFQVNSKVAAVCIAVAVVVAVGSAFNRASTSRPSVQSSTTSVTTEATTKQEKKNSASKPSSSSKPSALIKYAADENNISVDDISETEATGDGKYMVTVYISQNSTLSKKLAVRAMHNDICSLIEPLQNCSKLDTLTIFVQGSFVDSYGKESKDTVMRVNFNASTINKIDFSSDYWDSSNIPDVADGYWLHKSLQE